MKLSNLSKTSILLFVCYGVDKCVAILRQLIIARQFGLSVELDVFNIANNLPDMLFTLISGGALSMALIPVMADIIDRGGRKAGWKLFSSIANLAFITAAALSVIIAIFAEPIVVSEIGIAPGFTAEQQALVVELMRLNLIATLIFSLSGLVMGGLQANRHFLLPALAPIFYNLGQIFGALIMAPTEPYRFGPITLPCLGLGIYGLVYGVILGAVLHLLVQVPALIRYEFRWYPIIRAKDDDVRRVLRVLGPRVISVFFVQLIFIIRDNFASRLAEGSVTALSYGYMFQQLPETLIGTAIGTAILPSLSLYISRKDYERYRTVIQSACRIALALSFGSAAVMAVGLGPLIQTLLGFDAGQTDLMMWTLRGFLVGLAGHCLLEIANRAYYAQEEARVPLMGTILNVLLYIGCGMLLYKRLDAPGISLTDSIAFTAQAVLMLLLLARTHSKVKTAPAPIHVWGTVLRSALGALFAGGICFAVIRFLPAGALIASIAGMILAMCVYIPCVIPELKLLKSF